LLDLNMLDSGVMSFHPTEFDFNEAILAVVEDYRDRMNAKNITAGGELAPGKLFVYADRGATLEVLDNLISNAVKYSPHGTVIGVRSSLSGSIARFEVQDSGMGIDPADHDKLFRKFVRLGTKPTGGESSTGLGLSIVKKMVDAMSGRVWCESELGRGATFIVELPVAQQILQR
jgi:signal transduction histidine kinase